MNTDLDEIAAFIADTDAKVSALRLVLGTFLLDHYANQTDPLASFASLRDRTLERFNNLPGIRVQTLDALEHFLAAIETKLPQAKPPES